MLVRHRACNAPEFFAASARKHHLQSLLASRALRRRNPVVNAPVLLLLSPPAQRGHNVLQALANSVDFDRQETLACLEYLIEQCEGDQLEETTPVR